MEINRCEFVRFVRADEAMDDLVHQAKHLTWEHYREHALLELEQGRRVLVGGGQFGIELDRAVSNDPFGRPPDRLYLQVEQEMRLVTRLIFHVHPKPTGPSDDDLLVLKLLGQPDSMLYELFGPAKGTQIKPKQK